MFHKLIVTIWLQTKLCNPIDKATVLLYNVSMFTLKDLNKIDALTKELNDLYEERNAEIRRLYETGDWTYQRLAEKFRLTRQRVEKIVKGGTE